MRLLSWTAPLLDSHFTPGQSLHTWTVTHTGNPYVLTTSEKRLVVLNRYGLCSRPLRSGKDQVQIQLVTQ